MIYLIGINKFFKFKTLYNDPDKSSFGYFFLKTSLLNSKKPKIIIYNKLTDRLTRKSLKSL